MNPEKEKAVIHTNEIYVLKATYEYDWKSK